MKKFKELSTTADTGLEVYGKDFAQLLTNSLAGLNQILFGKNTVSGPTSSSYNYRFKGDSFENVVVNFLSEILFIVYTKDKMAIELRFTKVSDKYLDTDILLTDIPAIPALEIKSVTYHNLKILEKNGIKSLQIIFDI